MACLNVDTCRYTPPAYVTGCLQPAFFIFIISPSSSSSTSCLIARRQPAVNAAGLSLCRRPISLAASMSLACLLHLHPTVLYAAACLNVDVIGCLYTPACLFLHLLIIIVIVLLLSSSSSIPCSSGTSLSFLYVIYFYSSSFLQLFSLFLLLSMQLKNVIFTVADSALPCPVCLTMFVLFFMLCVQFPLTPCLAYFRLGSQISGPNIFKFHCSGGGGVGMIFCLLK